MEINCQVGGHEKTEAECEQNLSRNCKSVREKSNGQKVQKDVIELTFSWIFTQGQVLFPCFKHQTLCLEVFTSIPWAVCMFSIFYESQKGLAPMYV